MSLDTWNADLRSAQRAGGPRTTCRHPPWATEVRERSVCSFAPRQAPLRVGSVAPCAGRYAARRREVRRSKPGASPPPRSSTPRWEPPFRMGVTTCAAPSAARAGRRPAFQAGGVTSAAELHAEVGATLPHGGYDVRGAERRACRSETGVPSRGRHLRRGAPRRGGSHPSAWGLRRARCGAPRVPVGDRRSRPRRRCRRVEPGRPMVRRVARR